VMEVVRLFFEIVGMITTTAMIFGGIALFFGWFLAVIFHLYNFWDFVHVVIILILAPLVAGYYIY
jgi:hypothetical protein